MVSRIEVIPSEVRGYGNIVEAKSLEDFVPVGSELVYSENVYSLTALEGLRITLTASSSSISYGSSLSLSATVVENDEPVTGVSVSFYDGSTSLGSATTNSSGVATYTTSSLTVGAHTCTAVYDETTSNSVSVTVNKLSSTISLTVPASGTVGTAYTVTGTLVPSSGSVKLYENGSLKDTLTVSSGAFSKSITQNSEGTYSYYAVFEGSSTYEGSTSSIQSITVEAIPVPSYNGVSLTSDKSILSYADSDSCTLTAQLLDGSSSASVSGVTVEFFNGSTSLGTATTNSSGVATKVYASAGVGDMTVTAEADTYSSEEVSIEDCIDYQPLTSNATASRWTIPSGVTSSYSSNGWRISASAYRQIKLTDNLTSECSVEFTYVTSSGGGNYSPVIVYQYTNGTSTPNQLILNYNGTNSFNCLGTTINHAMVEGAVYRIDYTSSTLRVYENDTLLASTTNNIGFPTKFEWHMGANSRYAIYKDLKVKPL